jgi:hypothetical protein
MRLQCATKFWVVEAIGGLYVLIGGTMHFGDGGNGQGGFDFIVDNFFYHVQTSSLQSLFNYPFPRIYSLGQ